MSFVKGFLISFVLSFLVFAVIILYGGSFALTLVEGDEEKYGETNLDGVEGDDVQNLPIYSSHERFSFALVITDEAVILEEQPEEIFAHNEDQGAVDDNAAQQDPATQPEIGSDDSAEAPGYVTEFDEIIGENDKKYELEIKYICVVSINSTVGKSFITVIPGDSLASVANVEMSLSEVFVRADTLLSEFTADEFIKSTVIASTGITPDFLGYVDLNDFVKLADELGNVKYKLTTDIMTENSETGETEVLIPSGEITLDSENLLTLLTYDKYDSRYADSQILIDTAKEMLSSICDKFRSNIIAKVREMLFYVDTDFTTSDMSRISHIFFAFRDSDKTGAALLGAYENLGEMGYLFRVNINGSVNRFKQYLN